MREKNDIFVACCGPLVLFSHALCHRPASLPCEECGKTFPDAEAVWQHRISKHSVDGDTKPMGPLTAEDGTPRLPGAAAEDLLGADTHWVPCDVCGQAVPGHWVMGQHLETLKPLLGLRARCMVCDKVGGRGVLLS